MKCLEVGRGERDKERHIKLVELGNPDNRDVALAPEYTFAHQGQ